MPLINVALCTKCLKCVRDCPARAITIETGEIADTCIHCGHCVAICPEMAVTPPSGMVMPLQPNEVSAAHFKHLTRRIRSCRSYLPKPVPDSLLRELVQEMSQYPSASNARPLQITIVRTPERMQLLNDLTAESLLRMFSLITAPVISQLAGWIAPSLNLKKLKQYKASFLEQKETNDSIICHHAPAAILFHGPVTRAGMLEADANIWATYTSVLAATMGLATCFNGFIVKAMGKNSRQNRLIGIPPGHRVYASLLIGYPRVSYKNECSRPSPEAGWL